MSATFTDMFCGAGGSSIGAEMTGGAELVLGLNHWKRAIETHAHNFQHADHDCEDVSSLTTGQIRRYPDSDVLLASPECTNHSLAKGARRKKPQAASLWDDGPAGDEEQERSRATMYDVCRFAEQKAIKGKPYKAIIVENVVDAFNWGIEDNGGLFDAWLMSMDALGYQHEIVYLNSMFAGQVPQSRDRMYVVFWLKGIKAPNLRFHPPSWCPKCEKVVNGVQSWKKMRRGRPWGRYGPQYIFKCPECIGTVLPGAHPAAEAIDWDLPAQLIGERKKPLADATRARIKRGLERLAAEPFAIRVLQSGNPKPLTLPLVTQTARRDTAMVIPVAGNTYDRGSGNRSRAAEKTPMATLNGTLESAMVVPPMSNGLPVDPEVSPGPTQATTSRGALVTTAGGSWDDKAKIAAEEPLSTQTGTESKALVVPNRANNVPAKAETEPTAPILTGNTLGVLHMRGTVEMQRNGDVRAIREPVHTIRAGGRHHGVVMRNNTGGAEMSTPASTEPIRTLTSAGHQSLLVPYNGSEARPGATEPAPTLHTVDPLGVATELTDEDIDGCRFRMFELHEIAIAMAMHAHPDGGDYEVMGNKRERMAQYGNAVTPPATTLLLGRVLEVI